MDGANYPALKLQKPDYKSIERQSSRHANVVGWTETIEDRKDTSQQLAKVSRVIKLDSPAEKCMDCADKTCLSSS